MLKKKIWPNFPRIIEVSTQKIVTNRDPRSEIRDPEKTYSGSRIQGSKRHRIPDPGSESATLANTRLKETLPNSAQKAPTRIQY